MSGRERFLTPLDMEILREVSRGDSFVAACRRLGITRDRGTSRLRRMARLLGGPVALGTRGDHRVSSTRLTPGGWALLRGEVSALAPTGGRSRAGSALEWTWRSRPVPHVLLTGGGPSITVSFRAGEGQRVRIAIEPESILLAPHRFASSARNVLPSVIERLEDEGEGRLRVLCGVGHHTVPVAVTRRAVEELGLAPGRHVYLYLKATAVHPLSAVGTPASAQLKERGASSVPPRARRSRR
jgi:molybdopterin-binding protein